MEEIVRIKFISGLKDPEARLGLLDGIKTKPTMTFSELTNILHFRSQALVFTSSSTGNKTSYSEEVSGKQFQKFNGSKGSGHMCNKCGGKLHSSKPCLALNKKSKIWEKVGHYLAKMCNGKTQPRSCISSQHNNLCEEECAISGQTFFEMKMGMDSGKACLIRQRHRNKSQRKTLK